MAMSGGSDGRARILARIRATVSRVAVNLTPQERLIVAVLAGMLVAGTLTRSWRLARDAASVVPASETSPPEASE